MSSLIQRVGEHKKKARDHRDFEEWEQSIREYDRAVELLEETEAGIRQRLESEAERSGSSSPKVSQLEKDMVSELADCYGSRGGVQRRWGNEHYADSLKSYDLGYGIEAYPHYGLIDTYNTVNRIVARVLLDPGWAHGEPPSKWQDGDTLDQILVGARERLDQRLRRLKAEGKTDPWAEADAIMLEALRLDASEDQVEDAMARFDETGPPRKAYESGRDTVKLLADLPIPQQTKMRLIRDHFESKASPG